MTAVPEGERAAGCGRKEAEWPRLLRPLSGTDWREMDSHGGLAEVGRTERS